MPIFSFEPIVDDKCKILILGTMPSVMSLSKQQYYGNKLNAFWRIMYALFDREPDDDYKKRKAFVLQHHIAVWDVLNACEREGSSDSDIKNPVLNDFSALYMRYPNIGSVCFNGGPASRLYGRFVEKPGESGEVRSFYNLPSTSPAYTLSFDKKLEQWKLILRLLEKNRLYN